MFNCKIWNNICCKNYRKNYKTTNIVRINTLKKFNFKLVVLSYKKVKYGLYKDIVLIT